MKKALVLMFQIPTVCLSIHPEGLNAAKWRRFKFPLWSLVSVVYRNYQLFDLDHCPRTGSAILSCTTDRTSRRSFSRHFVREEIIRNRDRVAQRLQCTPGFDTATDKLFAALSVDALLRFLNLCLDLRSAPRMWMITVLIGILKLGKDATDAASHRLVGLESGLLKMFTLLWEDWFREWMEDEHILPDTQNGFRRGHHGANNPFILRCAIETVLGSGRLLYVILPDLTNAFPLTDHSSLWVMMYKRGVSGPLFDWLRSMYSGIRYCVEMGDSYSAAFDSDIGILAGDGTSPSVWDFFGSDFSPSAHPDDVSSATDES